MNFNEVYFRLLFLLAACSTALPNGSDASPPPNGSDASPPPKGSGECSSTKGWVTVASGTTQDLRSVWGDGSNVYAVGLEETILRSTDYGAHWASGSIPASPSGASYSLRGIWGVGSDFYVVGGYGNVPSFEAAAFHFANWGKFEAMPSLDGGGINAVWGTNTTNVYVSSLSHWDGHAWSKLNPPPGNRYGHVFATAIAPFSGNAVVFGGSVLNESKSLEVPGILAWTSAPFYSALGDGTQPGNVSGLWTDLSGDHPVVYAVGAVWNSHALLAHSQDLKTWTDVSGGDVATLMANTRVLHGITSSYAVGSGGTIFNWRTLKLESSGTTENLSSVWSGGGVWVAVGAHGTILTNQCSTK